MTWVIIGGILLVLFGWLLFAPLFLHVNTIEQKYSVGLRGIFKLSIISDEMELIYLRVGIPFYQFNYYPFKKKEKEKKKKAKAITKKPNKKWKILSFQTFWLILQISWKVKKSFRLKKLFLNFDSNDVITNAYLIPVFVNLNRNNIDLNINYLGDFNMIVRIENNIFRILVVTIKTYLHLKKIF